MPDREKVISTLEEIKTQAAEIGLDSAVIAHGFMDEIIDLLKEQEPTVFKPHYIDKYSKHFICGVECGSCHREISSTYHYCPYCGRKVQWDA